MDVNTMVVKLVGTVLAFAFLLVLVLRVDRLMPHLKRLKFEVLGWVKMSIDFRKPAAPGRLGSFFVVPHHGHVPMSGMVDEALAGLGTSSVDYLIVTHADQDHIGMLFDIFG